MSNSRFLGPVDIEFNPQFNCLIGGRGTGKSTVLEYLRWALCDQPPDSANEEDLPDFQLKRAELIENTLSPFEAVVTVEFELNGVPHVVRRKAEPPQISLKIGDDEFRECDEQEIRDLLPVQAYSQKQLSSVGVRTDELLRLLRSPVKSELADLDRREGQLLDRLRSAAEARHAKRRAERDIWREETQRRSLASQLVKLRKVLKGVTPEDQGTLNAHAGYEGERAYVRTLDDRLARLQEAVNLLVTEISLLGAPAPNGDDAETPNAELMAKLADAYAQIHTGAAQRAQALQRFLSEEEEVEEYKSRRDEWGDKSAQHAVSYEQAKGRASSQQSIIDAIADVEEKVQRLNNSISERQSEIERMGDPEAGFSELLAAWAGLASENAALLSGECDRLTALSDERIRATLVRGQDTGEIQRRLGALITGTRIRQAKIEKLCQHVSAADDPLSEWCAIAEELAGLVDIAGVELSETDLPETPLLNRIGFTAAELLRIASKITVQDWINVALAGIGDEPEFQYRQSEGEFIRFANASAGQQATALLQVLLKQSGPPLIIDQPEEDLDNEVVLDIVASIWAAKSKRQLLLSSHNANVVVNGDADLVVVCAYRNAGDHNAGTIANAGAIDIKRLRDAITSIMEGGERAFRLRQEKYGF